MSGTLTNAWSRLRGSSADEVPEKYLFIICMNNSGSTLLERVLKDCRNVVGFLAPGGPDQQVNGQRFVTDLMPTPGKVAVRCRRIWSEQSDVLADESRYAWAEIKQRWRREWRRNPKYRTANPRIFLEKSPANVLRATMLQKHFPESTFVLMQRNPYAVAEGINRRTKIPLGRCVQHWIRCAQQQIRNEGTLLSLTRFNYEDLSERPEVCRDRMVGLLPAVDDIDFQKEVSVQSIEGKVRRPIINYNQQQIDRLSPSDIAEINGSLAAVPEVMAHF
ncbi:MAG: sulfotransferase, partial [Chthoniobacterales bacterium]